MDSSDHQRKGSNERRRRRRRRRLLRLIRGGWPSKSFGLHIYRRKFAARSSFLIRNDYGVWSQAHRRLIRMTRLGYWIVYDLDAKELRTWYEERLLRDRGMARWPEYGAGDREEVRSLIARVREEYWRRMPEHRRQKFVARLEEERRLKEESDQRQQLAAAADERRGAQMAAVDDGKLRASSRSSTQPPPRRRRRRRRWAPPPPPPPPRLLVAGHCAAACLPCALAGSRLGTSRPACQRRIAAWCPGPARVSLPPRH
ncbi:Os01g0227900 [Oryza sativa Japonica Group]|uniref:Os01g0227900 protein n=1 Tax=Oryza sativa subsp. japonica TaxID=39947 RepID=A0A0P0V0R8_ORYSJ|nr:Os01g0227900 [Oryza sativa Japonica Group]